MTWRRTGRLAAVAGLLFLVGCPSPGRRGREVAPVTQEAQRPSGRDGDLHIGENFEAVEILGTADGRRDASALGSDCRGYVLDEGVNHVITLEHDRALTLRAIPQGTGVADLFIALSSEDAPWRCADDGEGLNPVLAGVFVQGQLRVLVGTTDHTVVPYSLEISDGIQVPEGIQLGGAFPPPATGGTPPERNELGTFGGARFLADTAAVTLGGQAGGTRRAGDVYPTCPGHIAQVPDHSFEVETAQALTFRVQSGGDTTLLIQGPGEQVWCTDDDEGLNPVLRFDAVPGTYHVFVGTWEPAEAPAYSLTVSR